MFYLSTLTSKFFSLLSCVVLAVLCFKQNDTAFDLVRLWAVSLILGRLGWVLYQYISLPDISRVVLTPAMRQVIIEKVEKHITFVGGMNVCQRIIVALTFTILLMIYHEYLLGLLTIATFFGRMLYEFEVALEIDSLKRI